MKAKGKIFIWGSIFFISVIGIFYVTHYYNQNRIDELRAYFMHSTRIAVYDTFGDIELGRIISVQVDCDSEMSKKIKKLFNDATLYPKFLYSKSRPVDAMQITLYQNNQEICCLCLTSSKINNEAKKMSYGFGREDNYVLLSEVRKIVFPARKTGWNPK